MAALDARSGILTILGAWSGFVAEKLAKAPPVRSVPQLSNFLLLHLEWIAAQPSAADFADQIDAIRQELLRTIDPGSGEHATSRTCLVENCTGTISTSPQVVGNTGRKGIRCSSGHTWEMREWITLRPLMERQRKVASA